MALDLEKGTRCFVCCPENPHGLQLVLKKEGDDEAKERFDPLERYKGWSKYLHGGIIRLIFDDLSGWLFLNVDIMP